jgi:hypothetical protein
MQFDVTKQVRLHDGSFDKIELARALRIWALVSSNANEKSRNYENYFNSLSTAFGTKFQDTCGTASGATNIQSECECCRWPPEGMVGGSTGSDLREKTSNDVRGECWCWWWCSQEDK